jgi:hypothetical protein
VYLRTLRRNGGFLVIASLALTACATPPPVRQTHVAQNDLEAASIAAGTCLANQEDALDDGISPANVIGHQIAIACHFPLLRSELLAREAAQPYLTAGQIYADYSYLFPGEFDNEGTHFVLMSRKMNQAQSPK